jgi:TetR/AcrR family transcriptional regulator, tetracycline repressor protein
VEHDVTAQTRVRPGPRRTLSEEDILDAAMALLDEGGANAASIRGIAARVGVAPNAVYTYFPNKAAVVDALVERLLGDVDHGMFADPTQPWRVRVEALALELRSQISAHPAAVQLLVGGQVGGPNALTLNERLLELLAEVGLEPADAARAAYALLAYGFGSLALEVAYLRGAPGPLPPEAERVATRRARLTAETGRFPRTVAAADTVAGEISTDQYLWGLHRLLDGIAPAGA